MRKTLIALRRLTVIPIALAACGCFAAAASADTGAGQGALAPPTGPAPASEVVVHVALSQSVFHGQPAPVSAVAAAATARKLHKSVKAAVASTYCYNWTPYEKGENVFGGTVWQYNQGLYWCGNGSWITYRAASNNYGSNMGLGWSFVGNLGYTNEGGTGDYSWTHWNQGHFCLASYFSCVQNPQPWIQSTVYANGAGSASAG